MLVLVGHAVGQVTAVFQVASIKPNRSGDPASTWNISPGELVMRNITLKQLVQIAYDVRDYSMSGPTWLESERFDINAKTPTEIVATKDSQKRGVLFRGAMQALMADRFKLAVHHETRTVPAYALVVAKGGLKVKPLESDGEWNENTSKGKLTATKMSMDRLGDWLGRRLDRPVVDKTNLMGVFSFQLEYSPEQNPPADDFRPSIFTALQEQLGLRLQSQKLPVDIVVVDRVERVPTEN
jgi:uncharacterized protein (TIGR03435 family)